MTAAGASSMTAEDLRLPPNADARLPVGSCAVVLETPASLMTLALGSIVADVSRKEYHAIVCWRNVCIYVCVV